MSEPLEAAAPQEAGRPLRQPGRPIAQGRPVAFDGDAGGGDVPIGTGRARMPGVMARPRPRFALREERASGGRRA